MGDVTPPPPDADTGTLAALGNALRELRVARDWSGETAARYALISQSKISRIENGRTPPSLADVAQLLGAYQASEEDRARILALARSAAREFRSTRDNARRGFDRKQAELATFEKTGAVMRHFLPAGVTGLLQTRDYAEAVLRASGSVPPSQIDMVVDGKMARQEALADPERRFMFLLTETGVRARLAPPAVMAQQMARLADLAEGGRPEIAIVPFSVRWPGPPLNTFVVYDSRFVTAEVFNGEILLHDQQDVAYHLAVFERFWAAALTGQDAAVFLRAVALEYRRQ